MDSDVLMKQEIIPIEINMPRVVLELKHMKSGSNLILAISKLRVADDDLDTAMDMLQRALDRYNEMDIS